MTAAAVLLVKFYQTLSYAKSPIPNVCINTSGNHKLFGTVFVLILANVFSAMLGMLFIMYRKYEAYRSSLVKTFYRDGIGYFVLLSALALTNVIINFAPGVRLIFISTKVRTWLTKHY
ncbi:hypothetical protein EST38_g734 [Candolleomyces aberdarensis]|uniref:7TM GPCR serpentine receptor class x (Srx) domain-containing protein n=1 Tax=Candolleomyces aberdarensis TaxID=2316362 RepID=A0A4Q2DZB2_9AGAR|nr:hypothetical protein EST38_g734 [Candolleomyces aberdarensis]